MRDHKGLQPYICELHVYRRSDSRLLIPADLEQQRPTNRADQARALSRGPLCSGIPSESQTGSVMARETEKETASATQLLPAYKGETSSR
jgi:hypothetical protein